MASPLIFNTPSTFLEWDGSTLTQISPAPNASNDSSFYGNLLVLPTGQILFTDFFFVSVYNPAGTYNPAWAPSIQSAPTRVRPGGSYTISGHRFNGMSQGAAYGDDQQSATNYPLVRITNNELDTYFIAERTTTAAWPLHLTVSCLLISMCRQPKSMGLASLLSSLTASPPLPLPFRWTEAKPCNRSATIGTSLRKILPRS